MRILDLSEVTEGWKVEVKHVAGIVNREADGIYAGTAMMYRLTSLLFTHPDVLWQELPQSTQRNDLCS